MKLRQTILVAGSLLVATNVAMADGEAVYNAGCMACHAAGVAGAPKLEKDAWTDRLSKGKDELYSNAINGFQGSTGVMPAKGGFTHLSDDEVKSAVDFMLDKVQ